MNLFLPYLISFAALLLAELLYFKVAGRFGIVDRPNGRSSHTRPTIRGGGIVFPLAALLAFLFGGFAYPWFLLGLLMLAVVEFTDDVRSLPDSVRLVAQFAAMALMFLQLGLFSGGFPWWYVPLALILFVGIVNAFNFMDGINGITGGYSLAVLLPLICINRLRGGFIDESLLVITAIAALIFCFFNFRTKARCFAGDVGSVSIAFILLFALGALVLRTGDLSWIVLLAVYGVDTVLTICHRIMLHENLGKAHRKHAYQLMANELHISHVKVSAFYSLLQLAISAAAILLVPDSPAARWIYLAAVLLLLCAAYILFMRKYYHLHEEYLSLHSHADR